MEQEQKINIKEILKYCPEGMELDCTIYEDAELYEISDSPENEYPIRIKTKNGYFLDLTKYGTYTDIDEAKCVIFPKGKTTWEGFQRPFKDGDIIYISTDGLECDIKTVFISIFKECNDGKYNVYACYCVDTNSLYSYHITNAYFCDVDAIIEQRLATEEEKDLLFKSIKNNGYKWNEETKTLEKLIVPKFKVGDKIRHKTYTRQVNAVTEIRDTHYILDDEMSLIFRSQDDYELVPNKFDIANLKPFDKVLVRGNVGQIWTIDFFSFMDNNKGYPFVCVGHYVTQCIPYEGNEHLLGTTDDCDEYYKTWE